jgi:hypothetical protein
MDDRKIWERFFGPFELQIVCALNVWARFVFCFRNTLKQESPSPKGQQHVSSWQRL